MKQDISCFNMTCIFHEDWSILDKATANQTLAMTKNVERTKSVKGVINVEVTNDNIKKITLLLNNNWTVAHTKSGERNEAINCIFQDEATMNQIHCEVYFIWNFM